MPGKIVLPENTVIGGMNQLAIPLVLDDNPTNEEVLQGVITQLRRFPLVRQVEFVEGRLFVLHNYSDTEWVYHTVAELLQLAELI